jgi:signal transduction histidine kinase
LALAAVLAFGIRRWERRRTFQRVQRLKQQGALERERARISRDLHDEMGVGLTEIGLLGDLAGADSPAQDGHKELAGEISTRARGLVAALDEIVWAINPANDNTLSLGDYFSRYAQTLLQRAGLRCRLEVGNESLDAGINAEQRHHLFLSFKEALNNVITHAGATEVRILIRGERGVLTISVADNGHGIETSVGSGTPDGLRGMRERLANIGGRFDLQSTPESGTTVTFTLPIEPPPHP